MAKYHIYQDKAGQWRWHLKASNGRIVADSAQGYGSERHVRRAVEAVQRMAGRAVVVYAEVGR